MRKAIASVGLAVMLSMGIGTAAMAQTNGVSAPQAQVESEETEDSDNGQLGLIGLVGLLGLAGLLRRGGGGSKAPSYGTPVKAAKKGKAPRGGYSSDWSNR